MFKKYSQPSQEIILEAKKLAKKRFNKINIITYSLFSLTTKTMKKKTIIIIFHKQFLRILNNILEPNLFTSTNNNSISSLSSHTVTFTPFYEYI